MARLLIVWSSCFVLALLGVTGAHGHRSVAHADTETHDPAHGHISLPELPPLTLISDSSAHEHGHAKHGHVDVDPLVKVFSKTQTSLNVDVAVLLWIGIAVLIVHLASTWAPITRLERPPKKRWHPFQLPPAQAPPRTA